MDNRSILKWLVPVGIALMSAACSGAKPQEIAICAVGDLSGPVAPYGNDMVQGAQIAAEEINAAGGVGGTPVVVRIFDEKNDPVEAVKIAQRAADECIAAIVGSGSGPALASAPYYEEAGMPFILTTSSNVKATSSGWQYVNRIQLSDYDQIEVLSEFVAGELGISRIAVLHNSSDMGIGGRDNMIEIWGRRGDIEMTTAEAWREEDVDFSSQLLNAQRSGAEAIWILGGAEAPARMLAQAETLGIDVQFLANTSVGNQKFLDLAGDSAEGMYITWGVVDPSNPIVQELDRKMKEKFNRNVDVFVGHAYDAMYILADAMETAGTSSSDRADIQAAIRGGSYEFSLGPLSFDENGHNIRHIFIAEVVNGEFQIVK